MTARARRGSRMPPRRERLRLECRCRQPRPAVLEAARRRSSARSPSSSPGRATGETASWAPPQQCAPRTASWLASTGAVGTASPCGRLNRRPGKNAVSAGRRAGPCRRAGAGTVRDAGWRPCWRTSLPRACTIPGTGRRKPAETGQFEQHIRAICGWPLGDTRRLFDAEMRKPDRRGRAMLDPAPALPAGETC